MTSEDKRREYDVPAVELVGILLSSHVKVQADIGIETQSEVIVHHEHFGLVFARRAHGQSNLNVRLSPEALAQRTRTGSGTITGSALRVRSFRRLASDLTVPEVDVPAVVLLLSESITAGAADGRLS